MTDLDILEGLLNCTTVDALHASAASITKDMGFEYFLYGVQVNTSLTRPYQFILNGYPEEWRARYVEQRYQEIDPTVRHCITEKQVTPIAWDGRISMNQREKSMWGESMDFGLRCGASFAVHGGNGEAAMLSVATSCDSLQAKQEIYRSMGIVQLLACYLHEAVQKSVLTKGPLPLTRVDLTEREKECLLWVAEGKTSGEIADILSISERTVIFHLQNAGQKMGTSNRLHAISRAISMGLIVP